ncbi:hypothetical protein ASG47_04160 [Devosia sp. Leaf420]|uniref:TadE/TadG family type IV pilus assembly protein n=1 Tax=Devosia sp. Leaf420 TaxID=1736374 RepID=UPI000712BB1C|nr:pilus assembly protein TadG-related protein [Devosia sp. Leaf420]KQT49522.1 hypothetical protein ASG47_04160 [Devosia sp. Leaf420]
MTAQTKLARLLRRFAKDEGGAFAVMFGVMAIVLIALGGAVVDYVTLEQGRNRAQLALDAAALALQPKVFDKNFNAADVQKLAQAFVIERVANSSIDAKILTTRGNPTDGSLHFEASISVPTAFVALVGVPKLNANVVSEATRKKLALEVVMVLDNSGSMGSFSRMTYLKSAAKCATNTLFYDDVVVDPSDPNSCVAASNAKTVPDVKLGVVPFTMFVNVGSKYANATWLDRYGASSSSNDNFDNDDDDAHLVVPANYSWPNRLQLFAATGESWRGCVEERPHTKSGTTATEYLDTDDTLPTSGDTLFIPMFSPDLASGTGGNNYISDSPAICDRPAVTSGGVTTDCVRTLTYSQCNATMSNSECRQTGDSTGPVGPVNFTSTAKFTTGFYGSHAPSCDCRIWSGWSGATQTSGNGNNRTFTRTASCVGQGYVPTGLSTRELQERMCKYYAGVSGSTFSSGPNADCVRTPIQELTTSPTSVQNTISAMQAEGGTNIHVGTAWGFRVLSPTAPFSEGGVYDEATSKVMIIMTDGENTAYNLTNYCNSAMRDLNGSCYNSAYGFPNNSRNADSNSTSGSNIERLGKLGTSNADLVTAMNERTSQTCQNAKAAGITVYTIGLSTDKVDQSTPDVVRAMLRACASTPEKAYFPTASNELQSVFSSIANELSALRLAI